MLGVVDFSILLRMLRLEILGLSASQLSTMVLVFKGKLGLMYIAKGELRLMDIIPMRLDVFLLLIGLL
jgi:hypothetical protein